MNVKNPPKTDKSVRRGYYLEKRKILIKNKDAKAALDKEIQSRLILSPQYREAEAVLVYAAREHEISTSMIIHAAIANHKIVALPRCEGEGIMRFYRITGLSDLESGRYGIPEPRETCEPYHPESHALCVCPALCCDMSGYRLGFGGGYYDRFLSGFEGVSAALCYIDGVIPELIRDSYDIPVDMIVTEEFVKVI